MSRPLDIDAVRERERGEAIVQRVLAAGAGPRIVEAACCGAIVAVWDGARYDASGGLHECEGTR